MAKKFVIYRLHIWIQPQAFYSVMVYGTYGHKLVLGGELYNVAYRKCIYRDHVIVSE